MTPACSRHEQNSSAESATPEPAIGVEEVELRELIAKSERPFVLVNFFATWCKPCRTELPDLVNLEKDPNSEVKVLLVSIDNASDAKSKLRGFLAEFGVDFQTYARPSGNRGLIQQFHPAWDGRIPLTLLYDREGNKLEAIRGLTDRAEIELIINKNKRLGS